MNAGRSSFYGEIKVNIEPGDKIRIIKIPDGLGDPETTSLFQSCLGRIFPVVGIVPVPETNSELLELQVGEVLGQPHYMHSIWIEKEFVELIEPPMNADERR